jgi:hypothetical protein
MIHAVTGRVNASKVDISRKDIKIEAAHIEAKSFKEDIL